MTGSDPKTMFQQIFGNDEDEPTPDWQGFNSKQAQVEEAKQRNIARLKALSSKNDDTWVNDLGLDPDSVTGGAVNLGASATAATIRAAGDLTSIPDSVSAMTHQMNARPEVTEAYNRYQAGRATDDDWALLNSRYGNNIQASEKDGYVPESPEAVNQAENASTNLEVYGNARESTDRIESINEATDYSGIVDQSAREAMSEDLRAGAEESLASLGTAWEGIKDGELKDNLVSFVGLLSQLVVNGGEALLTNPQAMMEYTVEQVPDLAIGAVSKPALFIRNMGYGLEAYQQGIEKYAAENDGQVPSKDQQYKMAANALGMGLLDSVGEFKILDSSGNVRKAIKNGRSGLKASGKAVGQNAVVEGGTEGLQTKLEGEASLDPATGMEIYEGAALGTGVGTTLTAPAVAKEAATGTGEKKADDKQKKSDSINETLDAGDGSKLTQPESFDETAPAEVATEVFRRGQNKDAKPAEQKQSGQTLAELRSNLDAEIGRLEKVLDGSDELKRLNNEEAEAKTKLQAARKDGDKAKADQWKAYLRDVRDIIKTEKEGTEATRKAKKRLKTLQNQREVVDRSLSDLDNEVIASKDRIDEVTNTASDDSLDTSQRTAAAKEMTVLGQIAPDNVDMDAAARIAEDTTLDLADTERNFLRSLTTANQSRNRAKSLGGVSQDIFGQKASEGFKSLNEYRANVSDALRSENVERASQELDGLRAFAESHRRKASMARKAMESDVRKGKQVQIVSKGNGQWEQVDGFTYTDEQLKENGGISLSTGSDPLVQAISAEAEAITDTGKELAAAISMSSGNADPATQDTDVIESTEQPEAESTPEKSVETPSTDVTEEAADAPTQKQPQADTTQAEPETAAEPESEPTPEPVTEPDTRDGDDESDVTTDPEVDERAEESVEPEAEAEPTGNKPAGMLNVFRTKAEALPTEFADRYKDAKGKIQKGVFSGINLVKQFLTQSAKSGTATTERPLVAHKDFLSALSDDPQLALDYVDARRYDDQNNNELSLKQQEAIEHFAETGFAWNIILEADLMKKDRTQEYSYQDLVQQLREVSPDATEENLLTAISYAAYSFTQDEAAKPFMSTDEQINSILFRNREHPVDQTERDVIGTAGDYQGITINSAGQKAVQALGIKGNKNTPKNLMPQLETAMGTYVVELLVRENVFERQGISHPSLGESDGERFGNKHQFVRLVRNKDRKPNAVAAKIRELNSGTGSVLDHLFGVEAAYKEPTFIKPTFNQKTIKGGIQNVPKRQQEIEQIRAERGYVIRENMMVAYDNLPDVIGRIVGKIDTDNRVIQSQNRLSTEGFNDDLQRGVDFFRDFAMNPMNRGVPFYLVGDVYKQQRVGIKSNTINPQTDKHQRHMISLADWEVSIDTDKSSTSNRMYRVNLATGLGIDTDKQTIGTSLTDFDNKIKEPAIAKAIEILTELWKNPDIGLDAAQQELVAEGVEAGGQNTHTLDALMGIVAMDTAKGDSFITDMMLEIDGVTNGPMLSQLQMGAAPSAQDLNTLLNKGGFYELDSEYSNYPTWKQKAGEDDLYQDVAKLGSENIQQQLAEKPFIRQTLVHMSYFMNELIGKDGTTKIARNAIKYPINSVTYGSSLFKGVDLIKQDFIQSIYDKLEDALNNRDPETDTATEIKKVIDNLNGIMAGVTRDVVEKQALMLDRNMTEEQAQNMNLSSPANADRMKALDKAFNLNIGNPVKQALESKLGMYLQRRDVMTQGSQLTFQLYDVVYNYVREQYIDKLIADKTMPVGNDGKPRLDLTPEQEQVVLTRVGFMRPMVHTPLSKASKDLSSGLYTAKVKRSTVNPNENPNYSQKIQFAKDGDVKTHTQGSVIESLQDPGVATLVLMIHSSDSAISSFAAEKLAALNIHDAHGLSLLDAVQGGKNLNEATYKVMRDYSVPGEILNSLKRAIDGVVKMEGDLLNDPELQRRFREVNTEMYSGQKPEKKLLAEDFRSLFVSILSDLDETAYEAEKVKLENQLQMKSVNQYAFDGGEWLVTDAARAKTQEKLDALEKAPRNDKKGLMQDFVDILYSDYKVDRENQKYVPKKERKKAPKDQKITDLYTADDIAQAMGQLADRGYSKLAKRYTISKSLKEALDKAFRHDYEKNQALTDLWKVLIEQDGTANSIKHANKSTAYSILRNFEEIGSEFLPEKTFNDMQKVQTRMEQSELDLEQAANDVLSPARASALMSFLNKFYNSGFSYWGKLGESKLSQDQELIDWFEQKTSRTAKETIGFIGSRTDTNTGQGKFQRQLLAMVNRLIGDDVNVEYVTRDTAPLKGLQPVKLNTLTGFYSPELNTIYIKGRDFTDASVTPELIAHELVHAVTAHAIRDPKTPEAKELIKELEDLQARAKKKVDELSESLTPAQRSQYEYAVSSLDEFLAHGWTDAGFQKDILMRIQAKHTNRNNRLLDGLQEFLNKILSFLFKRNVNAQRVRGMEIFAANSMALMKDAARRSERKVQTGLQDQILGQRAYDNVQTLTTEQVFTALNAKETVSASQADYLRGLLDTVVANLHGPYGAVKAEVQANSAVTDGDDVFLKAVKTGEMPFAAAALNGPATFTRSEAYVLEQVEATLRAATDTGSMAYRDLVRVFRKARADIKPADLFDGDWSQATPDEKAQAQEVHDFVFKLQQNQDTGQTDHMSRFGALALVYPPLVKALQRPMDTTVTAQGDNFGDQVKFVFDKASRELSDRINVTYNRQGMDARVKSLVNRLVDIEAKKKAELAQDVNPTFAKMEDFVEAKGNKLREGIARAAGSDRVRNSRSDVVKAMGSVTKIVAEDRVDGLLDTFQKYRNTTFKGREGIVASAINEMRGERDSTKVFHKLLRESQKHEQNRKRMIDETSQQVLESFANKGKNLTQKEKEALTPVLLRTGLADLMPDYSLSDLTDLVNNPNRLSQEIQKVESRVLKSGQYGSYYNNQAINLAYKMATGWVAAPGLQMNASNIAKLLGTQYAGKVTDAMVERVTPDIDTLVSLNALKFTNSADRVEVGRVMRNELARGQNSGVAFVLGYHKKLQEKSKTELFNDNTVQFMKGYTKEIYNPYINVVTAPTADQALMKKRGYERVHKLPKDAADVNTVEESLYVIRDGGLNRRVTGIMSFTGTSRRGSAVHAGVTSMNHTDVIAGNQRKNQEIASRQTAEINSLFKKGNTLDPYANSGRKNHLVPVMNEQGEVANYRYLMLEKNKNKILERTNSIDKVLGSMTGSVYDKVTTAEQNTKAVQALRDQYLAERMEKPEAFIRVSPDSKDSQIRESYHLLPSATKKAIRQVWGKEEMWVRADTYDMTFGYRKYALADAFAMTKVERNIAEQVLVSTIGTMFGEKASLRVSQAQDMWEAAVGMVKDIYVIKNLSTFIGNVMSNVSVLLWYGVSPRDIVKNHKVAIEGLLTYTNDRKALDRLKRVQEAGTFSGSQAQMDQQILELEQALKNSPVHELVDEGLFQTIMEDIDAEDDSYSYKEAMFRKIDEKTQRVPDGLKTATKTMLMTHDTPLYKLLYKSTQMSDFVARYTLHEHLMNRKKQPLNRDESLKKITEAFVNYDIPTSRPLQFMNDMGLVMFTKYYMRIQKVLLNLYQEQPARALGLLTFFSIFDSIPNITDSSFTGRIGNNPMDLAALELPGAVDEILPIKAGLSLFR